MTKFRYVALLILLVLTSCAEVRFPDSEGESLKQSLASEAMSFDIDGVKQYDLAGKGANSLVAYDDNKNLMVAYVDNDSVRKEYVEMLDETSHIASLDLDISPNGEHVVLGYLKVSEEDKTVIPEPDCTPSKSDIVMCHPVDPIVDHIVSLSLCYVLKDKEDLYFDEPVCDSVASGVVGKMSTEELESDMLNRYSKKLIARISNDGDFDVFTSGIEFISYIDSRVDKEAVTQIAFDGYSQQGVASMEMLRKTGEVVIAALGFKEDTVELSRELVKLGDDKKDDPIGFDVGIKSIGDDSVIVPISKSDGDDDKAPIGLGIKPPMPPSAIEFMKLFIFDGSEWSSQIVGIYTHLIVEPFAYNDLAVSVQQNAGVLNAIIMPYGDGAMFFDVTKRDDDLKVREHLASILKPLQVEDAKLLIRGRKFYVDILVKGEGGDLKKYELLYDGVSWIIPADLLSSDTKPISQKSFGKVVLRSRKKSADLMVVKAHEGKSFNLEYIQDGKAIELPMSKKIRLPKDIRFVSPADDSLLVAVKDNNNELHISLFRTK